MKKIVGVKIIHFGLRYSHYKNASAHNSVSLRLNFLERFSRSLST